MELQEATHFIVTVPCDRRTGWVPFQALVSALSWHATRLAASAELGCDSADENEDEEEVGDVPAACGGTDWQAVGHDGSERSLAELQEAAHAALAHQAASAAPCRLVLVYLDCAPTTEAEVAFLRRLMGRCVVHVFGECGHGSLSLLGLPHVALHHEEGQLPARLVWSSVRRQPPASLRPALAAAQFSQFCRSDFRLALGEDFDKLLAEPAIAAAGKPMDADLAPWQVLDYLEAWQPRLPVLAGSAIGCAADELLAVALAARDLALRLTRGAEPGFAARDRLAAVAAAQTRLARLLAPAPLVSAPLSGGADCASSCAGRFAGALFAAGLDPAAFGHSARPELERAMVMRRARFVVGFIPVAAESAADCCWRLECRRLDEADDSRTVIAGLLRLAGGRSRTGPSGARQWAAGATLTAGEAALLKRRLRLPEGFGEVAADTTLAATDAGMSAPQTGIPASTPVGIEAAE